MPPRLSRHPYDLSRLYRHDYWQLAIMDVGLLASVVEHKKVFFREAGRGTIWPGLEAFGYALQTPMSLRFEATTGTCARCSLAKLHRSIR